MRNPVFLNLGHILPLLLYCGSTMAAIDEDSTSRKKRRIGILPVPAFGYEPETKAYAGAVCLFNWRFNGDTLTRASNAKAEINYTQRKQFINEIGWNVFLPGEQYFTSGRIHFSKFPDYYWGQGNNTADSNRVGFGSLRFTADAIFLRNLGRDWFLGPVIRYVKYAKITYQNGSSDIFSELKRHEAFGIPGFTLTRDRRNNILLPTKGMYLFFQPLLMYKPRESYMRIVLDVRKYFSFAKRNCVSMQFKSTISNSRNSLDLAVFGGDAVARGFYAGRFRSGAFGTLQAEWKYTIYRRWGIAIFGGTSTISNDDQYPRNDDLNIRNLKYNYGGGIRFLIDRKENINLRLDYGIGSDKQSGFYVVFGEAF